MTKYMTLDFTILAVLVVGFEGRRVRPLETWDRPVVTREPCRTRLQVYAHGELISEGKSNMLYLVVGSNT